MAALGNALCSRFAPSSVTAVSMSVMENSLASPSRCFAPASVIGVPVRSKMDSRFNQRHVGQIGIDRLLHAFGEIQVPGDAAKAVGGGRAFCQPGHRVALRLLAPILNSVKTRNATGEHEEQKQRLKIELESKTALP